jgi:tRNA-dihydrouridine synthase
MVFVVNSKCSSRTIGAGGNVELLGGASPARLAEAAAIGEGMGYAEVNLNVGCRWDRMRNGPLGTCLMAR